jgi:hypothetical protein
MAARGVRDNVVYSSEMPRIWVQVSENFRYVGSLRFILKNAAWVEIYYFAEADGTALKRTFHVQFEGYLPDNAYSYHYPSNERVRLGDHDYIFDAAFWSPNEYVKQHPDTDVAQGNWLLAENGYDVDSMKDVMRERYVRLLDDAKRNEILFIYAENLALYGLTAADLEGVHASEWSRLRAEMHERSHSVFQVFDQPPTRPAPLS